MSYLVIVIITYNKQKESDKWNFEFLNKQTFAASSSSNIYSKRESLPKYKSIPQIFSMLPVNGSKSSNEITSAISTSFVSILNELI